MYVAALCVIGVLTVVSQIVMRAGLPSRLRDAEIISLIGDGTRDAEALEAIGSELARGGSDALSPENAERIVARRDRLTRCIADIGQRLTDMPVATADIAKIEEALSDVQRIADRLDVLIARMAIVASTAESTDARNGVVTGVVPQLEVASAQCGLALKSLESAYRLGVVNQVQVYRMLEILIFSGILAVLGLEAVLVFEPAVRMIQRQFAAIQAGMTELALSKAEAETAVRTKSEFLANMSHEVRTPMTAILGFTDLMLDPHQSAEDRYDCVHTIRRNGDHLLTIINDILDLSKIEAGHMKVESIDCSPMQVVQDVLALMLVRASAKDIRLAQEALYPLPRTIVSDPVRLGQILVNLVGNAVKFTDEGGVRLITRLRDAEAPNAKLTFEVVDTGVGMTEAQVANLFQPFRQADASTTRKFGGTGLGLAICKRLAGMLGGEITVTSQPGCGSCFMLTLNLGKINAETLMQNADDSGNAVAQVAARRHDMLAVRIDGRVLLAEDGPDNQRLISFVLKKAGAEVSAVENGRAAAEAALEAVRSGKPFDVILMDMQMPELDGYSATALLRSKGYSGRIIALTAHAMAGDRERCVAAGCDDYLTKPINREVFLPKIAQHVAESGKARRSGSQAA